MANVNIKDVDFKRYDFRFDESSDDYIREEDGFTEEIIKRISEEKGDPEWVRELRLKCLDIYNNMDMPCWGPSIEELDMNRIASYVRHKTDMKNNWEDVPEDIK